MASRVNTRFVAFLAIGLMLLGGGVMVGAYFALKKSGQDYVAIGDKMMAEQKYDDAARAYSKAVFKQRTNAVWIDKWIGALGKTIPSPRQVYVEHYTKDYLPALRAYSDALPEDVNAQKRYLGHQYRLMRLMPNTADSTWDDFTSAVEDSIKRFPDPNGPARELRYYRGMANVFRLVNLPSDKAAELVPAIRSDLEAALAANPELDEAVAELAHMDMIQADAARQANDAARADELEAQAVNRLSTFLEKHPGNTRILWQQMSIQFVKDVRADPDRTLAQLYLDRHDMFMRLFAAIQAQPPEKLDALVLARVCQVAQRSTKIGNAGVLDLLYALEAKAPSQIFLKMLIGLFESDSKHYEKAIAEYQKVVDTDDLPLSFEGWNLFGQRSEAYVRQIMANLAMFEEGTRPSSPDKAPLVSPDRAAQAMKDAKAIRGKLAEYIGDRDPQLMYVDAKIAYAEGDLETARVNLDRYNEFAQGRDTQALLLQGELMEKMGNTGAARTAFTGAWKRDPTNYRAMLMLADLEERQERYKEALEPLEALAKLYPAVGELQERISRVRLMATPGVDVKDPVIQAIKIARERVGGVNPDYAGAAEVLRAAIDKTHDPLLYPMLARVLGVAGERDEAQVVVNEGLAKFPGNDALTKLREQLKITDPLQGTLQLIDEDEKASAFQKWIWKYYVYKQFGKPDEAKGAFAEAVKIDPNHPVVLDINFRNALQEKNLDEAKQLADKATALDADHVGGLTYKSQLEVASGRLPDAAATLEAALEKDKTSVPIWRQLGKLRLALGSADLAAKSFQKALEIRPRDVESIKGYLAAKRALGQREEALEFARRNQDNAAGDMDFVDEWLSLEATAATGDRSKALETRQLLAKRFPDNVRNNAALALMLINSQQYTEAKQMIDRLRAGNSQQEEYVVLEIRWYVAQGNMRSAIETFNKWVTALPAEKHNEQPYIGLAQIFAEYGRYDAAIGALDSGRAHQDPKTMGADRKLGEMYFATGRYDRAIEVYDRVLATDPSDPEFKIGGQVVESNIRLKKYGEAKRRLDALGPGAESNARLMLLKGDILAGQGELDAASHAYDAAIALDKNDPIGYVKRAEFLAKDRSRWPDAEADLKQAVALSPRLLGARERLVALYMSSQKPDQAVEVMREGLIADQDNDTVRLDLIALYLQLNKDREAIGVVEDALNRRQEDPVWLLRGREVMYSLKRWNDAANYALRLWERKKDADAAIAYVDAALKTAKPDFIKIIEILGTESLNTQKDMRLLVARARTRLAQQRRGEAMTDLKAALGLVDQTVRSQAQSFFAGLTVVFPDAAERLKALDELKPADGYRGWLAFLYSNHKASIPETASEGTNEIRQIAESNAEVTLRKQAYAVLGSRMRAEKKYQEAIGLWQEGLKVDPADPELNNDVAYCLAVDLHKAEDALPFAKKAADAAGNNQAAIASVFDTLGTVYHLLNQNDQAEEALRKALVAATQPEELIAIDVHMAQVRLAQGRMQEAADFYRRADAIARQNQPLAQAYEADLKDLKEKTGSN